MVVGWIFGGAGCHAMSKGLDLSYKLGYLTMAALFCPVFTDFQGLSVPAKVYLNRPH